MKAFSLIPLLVCLVYLDWYVFPSDGPAFSAGDTPSALNDSRAKLVLRFFDLALNRCAFERARNLCGKDFAILIPASGGEHTPLTADGYFGGIRDIQCGAPGYWFKPAKAYIRADAIIVEWYGGLHPNGVPRLPRPRFRDIPVQTGIRWGTAIATASEGKIRSILLHEFRINQ